MTRMISWLRRRYWLIGIVMPAILLITACAGPTAEPATPMVEAVELEWWWWGEEEAPGIRGWVEETVNLFHEQNPHITVKTVEQTVDGLIPATEAAMAARSGPDMIFFFPFFPLLKAMFYGGLAPLDDYIPEEIEHYGTFAGEYATWEGKTMAMPYYTIAMAWWYNKDIFAEAGLDPEIMPETWDGWMDICHKVRAIGKIPFAAGMLDQWWSDFPWALIQHVNVDYDTMWQAFLGLNGRSLADPEFQIVWEKIDEMNKAGCFPEDIMSMDMFTSHEAFLLGEAAIYTSVEPLSLQFAREMGPEKMGVMLPPIDSPQRIGENVAPLTWASCTQYIGITSWSPHKEEAAQFLKFLHTQDRMTALYEQAGARMADDRFDTSLITVPMELTQHQWNLISQYSNYYNSAPPVIDEWIWPWTGKLLVGEATPAEVAQAGEEIFAAWREANPDMVEYFRKWSGVKE